MHIPLIISLIIDVFARLTDQYCLNPDFGKGGTIELFYAGILDFDDCLCFTRDKINPLLINKTEGGAINE